MLTCPKCGEPVKEIWACISDQGHSEVQGYLCREHGEVKPMEKGCYICGVLDESEEYDGEKICKECYQKAQKMNKKECSICGFSDNQEDMVRNDTTGEWEHMECVNDALQAEYYQRND